MNDRTDPTFHRDREKQFFEHATRLLDDDRLRLETRFGRRPITALEPQVIIGEPGVERGERLKRMMLDLGVSDRHLQSSMPVGERLKVGLSQRFLLFFKSRVGRMHVFCTSPSRELLQGQPPAPMDAPELNKLVADTTKEIGRAHV